MPFIDIRDLRVYYEMDGDASKPPLVLLNGALDTIDSDWALHRASFAARFSVLAYDHRGHGRTSASPGPFAGYEQLADDLEALLDALAIGPAHFCGFSDGGITLVYFALRRSERVRSLVLAGAQYTNDERTLAVLAKMTPERIETRFPDWAASMVELHNTYHGSGYWQSLMRQMMPMWPVQPNLTLDQLGQVAVPTLLIAGERDGFGHPEQQLAMRRAMPRAELCILPAAGHPVMNEQPELFQLAVLDFLRRVG
jgi:pimeloyl-ACP methyl ester carboxylesterase